MPTYSGWLKEQKARTDAVGWFAKYWFALEGRPKLSAVSSITEHLEQRGLFASVEHLTEAHDAAMKEYREVRAGIVRPVGQEPLPGMEAANVTSGTISADALTPGEIVDAATQAGVAAGQKHLMPIVDISTGESNVQAIMIAILKDLELIKLALGIARDEDGAVVRFPPAVEPFEAADIDWPHLYAVADHEL